MLVSMDSILQKAKKGHYGVPAFSATNEVTLRAAISAAEEENAPLIILCMWGKNSDMKYYGKMMNELAEQAKVPVALILDHSATYEDAVAGIHVGFNTIMVDRSSLPYDENVAQVKELVKVAHACGVGVEAELGHVGVGENYAHDGVTALTVPEEAVQFVKETGVDCLAVAIGTAHGVYKGTPKLRFDLLEELAEKIPVPLVLHGGSGTGDENIAKACQLGICKVNVANDVLRGAYNKTQEIGMEGNNIYGLFAVLEQGAKEACKHNIEVCGCAGKAFD